MFVAAGFVNITGLYTSTTGYTESFDLSFGVFGESECSHGAGINTGCGFTVFTPGRVVTQVPVYHLECSAFTGIGTEATVKAGNDFTFQFFSGFQFFDLHLEVIHVYGLVGTFCHTFEAHGAFFRVDSAVFNGSYGAHILTYPALGALALRFHIYHYGFGGTVVLTASAQGALFRVSYHAGSFGGVFLFYRAGGRLDSEI